MADDLDIPMPVTQSYRVPRRRGMDPGTKRLVLIAGGLGGVLLSTMGLWAVWNHPSYHPVPVIEPDHHPIRVKPENPGGLQVAGQNEEVLSGDAGTKDDKLAPPPETPALDVLKQQEPANTEKPAAPAPEAASPAPPAASASVLEPPHPAPPPPVPAAPRPAPANPTGHRAFVQLAAVSSEQAARAEWQRLLKKMPDLLAGHQPILLKADKGGQAMWRLRTSGFTDPAQATDFCKRVRAKGLACAVAAS
ncbi:MAG: SPOR domain-containing protein [Acetobacteraceae bacterium]|nr:SPOR domain-containing protein [Acetobacteraceae bacterium]